MMIHSEGDGAEGGACFHTAACCERPHAVKECKTISGLSQHVERKGGALRSQPQAAAIPMENPYCSCSKHPWVCMLSQPHAAVLRGVGVDRNDGVHLAAQNRAGRVTHAAIGMATECSATTRLKNGLSLSRVGQHVAIGMAIALSPTGTVPAQPCGTKEMRCR